MFERGYKPVRRKMEEGSKFLRSCFNCGFYGQENGRGKDVCLNNDVTQYDLIIEGNIIYCTQWVPYTRSLKKKERIQEIFKGGRRTGRKRLL